jgi:threonyl-tRNA synthetase
MPVITLPDNSQKTFDDSVSVFDIAQSIGAGLARAAIAGEVDGVLVDLSFVVNKDAKISIITPKDQKGLAIIRHSCAHLLAQAVQQLFPGVKLAIGPVIDNGFYYDFDYDGSFSSQDLARIEKHMQALIKENQPITRKTLSRQAAIDFFNERQAPYKIELINDLPEDQPLSIYEQGDFADLCLGPHLPSTGRMGAFKLTKVAGAYWRGDAKNKMLQRIYGTAWPDKKALNAYLTRLEEAEKRDHRKLGKQLNLFHQQEEAPGMVFWHPKGSALFHVIESYMRRRLRESDYQEVRTPMIMDRSLWERSGHWQKFGEHMFVTHSENRDYAIKPMNCPGHLQIYNRGLKSYRDLPVRLSEFGMVHRNEPSGALHGLMRVRAFTQDDAHSYCTKEQIQSEVAGSIQLLLSIYKDFGFDDVTVLLATRPDERIGEDEAWDQSEKALADALDSQQIKWAYNPGEGAFYGPKIEFSLNDCIGRVWQCGTVQLDFSMPVRLGAEYVTETGARQAPVMIHRAIFGSLERFIGILIEHYAGIFPLWLSPIQVVVMNIADRQAEYAQKIAKSLQKSGIRVTLDLRNEKIGFKIREQTLQRIPYLLILGDREVQSETVAVRTRAGDDLGSMTVAAFVEALDKQGRG